MIKCLYCGHECPDTAHICPNCGKPIINIPHSKQHTFDDVKEVLRRETEGIKQEEPARKNKLYWLQAGFYY